ncbi:MAG: phospholipase/carboxylesterase family protein [Myxococcaceae bacterium]|nr:phospholipase/carboxylesterase family protein [Myxococcaceae bacterium]
MRITTTLGGLECRVLQEGEAAPRAVVVLCHGFGAPGDDLVGLYDELLALAPSLRGVRFVFPAAPLSLAAMGYGDARAWWLIDFDKIQALNAGDLEVLQEFRQQEPEGMAKARAMLLKAVDELTAQTGLPMSKVVLGGFSQGAMITTDIALRLPEPPAALAILSGTLLVEDVWRQKAKARAGLPIFQSHGRVDPILRFDAAERLRDLFTEAGSAPQWVPFNGPHAIPMEVLGQLAQFLAARLP